MRRSAKSVGDFNRQGPLNIKLVVARMVRDLVHEAGVKQFLLYSTVSVALQEYPARNFMTLRRSVRAGLREAGIRVGTLREYKAMAKKSAAPPKAAVVKRQARKASEVDQALVQELTARIAATAQEDRRGRLIVVSAKVQEILKPYPDAWRLRRAVYKALADRRIDRCTASALEGRAGRKHTKTALTIAPFSLDDADSEEIDHEAARPTDLDLRAGFREEDELRQLEAQLSEDPRAHRGRARLAQNARRVKPRNEQSLVARVKVRLAAAKWLKEEAEGQEDGEVLSPLSRLGLHLVFRSLVPHLPSMREIREMLELFARAGIVREYDEKRAVVRVRPEVRHLVVGENESIDTACGASR